MRILWLINIVLPCIAEKIHAPISNAAGWLVGIANLLQQQESIELVVCFPYIGKKSIQGQINRISYYGFPLRSNNPTKYDGLLENEFSVLIDDQKPDIIHIWGTEYPHSLAMVRAAQKKEVFKRVVISIQGLCSIISKHFLSGIPFELQKKVTFRDFIKNENIVDQKELFEKRGWYEHNALQNVNHIIGRTTWDNAITSQINPNANYYFCNETLRESFYNRKWNLNDCEKHSIFMSQGNYPIKGLHFMLEALPIILGKFPKTHLFISGNNVIKNKTLEQKIRLTSYGRYILSLIEEYKISRHVTFLGQLNETQMVEQFLKAHVFVSASTIENSPNSIGEAMLLGVPVVSSDVGGVRDMLTNNEEGFTYQHDAPYMLAHFVCEIFNSNELAVKFSRNARQHAQKTHNYETNLSNLVNIYKQIVEC